MSYFNKLADYLQEHHANQFINAILYNSKNIKIAEFIYDEKQKKIKLEALNTSIKSLGPNDKCYFKVKSYFKDIDLGKELQFPLLFTVKKPIRINPSEIDKVMKIPYKSLPSNYFISSEDKKDIFKLNFSKLSSTFNAFGLVLNYINEHPFSAENKNTIKEEILEIYNKCFNY
jgi:hypothetical protein